MLLGEDGNFGESVAVSNGTLAVGAPYYGDGQGAVFVYDEQAFRKSWAPVAQPVPEFLDTSDMYGHAVALSGDTLVAGAPYGYDYMGVAYVFERQTGGAWVQTGMLTGSETTFYFGGAVAIDGTTIIVGAAYEYEDFGAIYIFEKIGGAWVNTAHHMGYYSAGHYGFSVGIHGDTAVAGAFGYNESTGSAFVFHRGSGLWPLAYEFLASDGVSGDEFGYSVAVSGGTVLSSALSANDATGAVYVAEGLAEPDDESSGGAEARPGSDGILVTWRASDYYDVMGYNVYRAGTSKTEWAQINEVLIEGTQYFDATAIRGERYYYMIMGVREDETEVTSGETGGVWAGVVTMYLGGVSNEGGQTILLPVSVSNATGIGRQRMDFNILYPADLIDGDVSVIPSALTADVTFTVTELWPGYVSVVGEAPGDTNPLVGDGPLCYLEMTLRDVLETPACGEVTFDNALLTTRPVRPFGRISTRRAGFVSTPTASWPTSTTTPWCKCPTPTSSSKSRCAWSSPTNASTTAATSTPTSASTAQTPYSFCAWPTASRLPPGPTIPPHCPKFSTAAGRFWWTWTRSRPRPATPPS